jgi:hypothetical protein
MADESYEFVQSPDGSAFLVEDKIASRVDSYTKLVSELRNTKEKKLFDEGLLMLARIRLSISVVPETQISVVHGGKNS